MPSKKHESVTQ